MSELMTFGAAVAVLKSGGCVRRVMFEAGTELKLTEGTVHSRNGQYYRVTQQDILADDWQVVNEQTTKNDCSPDAT